MGQSPKRYLLQTDTPAASNAVSVAVAKLRPHHIVKSLALPAAAMAAVVPPII